MTIKMYRDGGKMTRACMFTQLAIMWAKMVNRVVMVYSYFSYCGVEWGGNKEI